MEILLPLLTALVICVSVASIKPAAAASCANVTPEEHLGYSPLIFFGKPVSGVYGPKTNTREEVEFEILRAYKGVSMETKVRLRYFNDHGHFHGWGFSKRPTLVFAIIDSENTDRQSDTPELVGQISYCLMALYHTRPKLHPEYWDLLAHMRP